MNDFEDFDLPSFFDKNEEKLNCKINKLLNVKEKPDLLNSGYAVKTSYHNGVKNY